MFEKDPKVSQLKKDLKKAGCWDAGNKIWFADYKKTRKNLSAQVVKYHEIKEHLIRIMDEARHLELILQTEGDFKPQHHRRMQAILSDFEATGPKLTSEFLISQADGEYLSTLKGLCGMEKILRNGNGDPLLYQSEVENLILMTREVLDREKPDLFRVTFFYLRHQDGELRERPYCGRLEFVDQIFEKECIEISAAAIEKIAGRDHAAEYRTDLFAE